LQGPPSPLQLVRQQDVDLKQRHLEVTQPQRKSVRDIEV
jgi:hypothetical protein